MLQYDDTILHYAAFHNKYEICKYLIEKKADPNLQNKRKKSPMEIAKSKNFTNIVKLFEKKN